MAARNRAESELTIDAVPGDLDLLGETWGCWLRAGQRMPAHRWDAPSSLSAWTVRELYAHVARGVGTLADLTLEPLADGQPELPDAAAYFGVLMARGPASAEFVADTARQYAAGHSNAELTSQFAGRAATVLARARATPAMLVATIAGSMRLIDYALTRILEATVHLLDLRETVPDADPPPEGALRRAADVIVDLTKLTDFLRLATGRPHPPVFPVLT